jgi:transcriptional regulator with XRE-family HTH domain
MTWQPAFGQVLKRRRELTPRLTQKAVAAKVRCHTKTVVKWEAGRQMPRDATILKLIDAVGAEPKDFLQEVAALCVDRLRKIHERDAVPDEVLETAAEWPAHAAADLPTGSPAGSIGPELKELHRAIDQVVVGLATILAAQGER